MKAKLRALFSNRWVLAGIGLLLLALLIWYVGPAIAIFDHRPLGSVSSRVVLILLTILVWAGFEAWKKYAAWRANKKMLTALTEGEKHDQNLSAKEVADLRQRFEQALSVLKQARFENKTHGGRGYLYQLPWYVFIGAPGSGKTTALVNSGLRFPLADKFGKEAVRGVGGTRNCDWWFTDEAVLLDTAGRYTTQTSNQAVDSAAWSGFLKLLKRFRPRQPLNGAIITLSVSDLLTQTAAERKEYGHAVRQRVQELYQTLGTRFPLYVMVTKCDLLAGFLEFFADLGREDRAQVWGATYPFHTGPGGSTPLRAFEQEFDLLEARLNERLYARLEDERDLQRRNLIYVFPQQFAKLRPMIAEFLEEVFGGSAFEEQAMLRGVYFTSGTQEGTPFDRVLGTLSRTFGLERQVLPPASGSGKSYFITRLLREVVFAESDLTGHSEKIEARRRQMLLAGYGLLGVVAIALVAGWLVSYFRNQTLVQEIAHSAEKIKPLVAQLPPPQQGRIEDILPVLDAVRDLPTGYAKRDEPVPLTLGLGLYQGEKLGAQAIKVYRNLLRDALLPRIALRLEEQIRNADNPEDRYDALKNYLMLYHDKHIDVADLEGSLLPQLAETDRQNFKGHLHAALSERPLEMILPEDKTLVEDARRQLALASLPERAYSRLKRLGAGGETPPFRISDAAGPSAPLVFTRASGKPLTEGIPGLFTAGGYRQTFRSKAKAVIEQLAKEETWVLGPQYAGAKRPNMEHVLAEVQRLYLHDYIRQWDETLGDLRLVPTRSLQQSIQTITLLASTDSPLRQLLNAVAKETKLTADKGAAEVAAGQVADKLTNKLRQTYDRLIGDSSRVAAAATDQPEAVVDRHFEPLHRLVVAPQGGAAPIDSVLGLLKEYEVHLRAAEQAVKLGVPQQSDAMILARIKGEADRLPQPLRNLLHSLIASSTDQAAKATQQGIQKAVAGGLGSFCQQAIQGRYPFVRGSAKEVALGDFARLFGPGGQLDNLFKTNLQHYVDMSGPQWKPIGLAEGVASVTQAVVTQFQRATAIRDAFFPGGAPNPAVMADFQLVQMDGRIMEITLINEGQTYRFMHNRPNAIRLSWPSLSPGNQLKMIATMADGAAPSTLSVEGPWALFRLLDHAVREGGTSDRLHLTFNFEGRKATFELRANSVRNPFRLKELEQFRCPA